MLSHCSCYFSAIQERLFLQIVPSYNSFSSRLKNPEFCIFHKIKENFEIYFFLLEDIAIGSPTSHMMDIFSQPTYHKNLMILAFIGAELAGGQILPPLPLRVILDPIPGRGISQMTVFSGRGGWETPPTAAQQRTAALAGQPQ